jgi:TolA-binding protein
MTRDKSSPAPQLQQLIEQARSLRPVSQATRARVLRRAQSSALQGASVDPSKVPLPRTGASAVTWLGGAALVVGLVGAGVALRAREASPARDHAKSAASSALALGSPLASAPSVGVSSGASEAAAPAASTAETATVSRPAPILESYAAELALMRRAHAAYGSHDFAAALRLLSEHGRRFPNGRLAEEREALRVRALSGSGLNDSARLAAHAFAARFPRSVLLSRTMAAADAGE